MDKQLLLSEQQNFSFWLRKSNILILRGKSLCAWKTPWNDFKSLKYDFHGFCNCWHGLSFISRLTSTKFFLHFYFKVETTESSTYLRAVGFFKATSKTKDTLPQGLFHSLSSRSISVWMDDGLKYFSKSMFWLKPWRLIFLTSQLHYNISKALLNYK